MRMVRYLAVLAIASTIPMALSTWAAPAPSPDVELPDSPAGRCARAYFAAMNFGDDAAMEAFEQSWRSAAALARRPLADRVEQARNLRAEWGDLTPTQVMEGDVVSVIANAGALDEPLQFTFEMDPAEPSKLQGIAIERGPGVGVSTRPLDPESRKAAVEALCDALDENYVFPDIAARMRESLRSNSTSGEYDSLRTDRDLARRLTDDCRAICHDRHLGIMPRPVGNSTPHDIDPFADAERDNYGFRKVELLPGNIGYIRFDLFYEGPEAHRTAAGALALVAHCDALVFDLRQNGGGSPDMIRFITSYLFDSRTLLNTFQDRTGKTVEETWTLEEIPGERFPTDLPVYVLTSSYSFSGAEEFTYNLKNLERATIIGETTGGGAHPVMGVDLGDRFVARIPYMRAVNPITKTNWEGTGIEPHIKVPASDALDRALEEARKRTR